MGCLAYHKRHPSLSVTSKQWESAAVLPFEPHKYYTKTPRGELGNWGGGMFRCTHGACTIGRTNTIIANSAYRQHNHEWMLYGSSPKQLHRPLRHAYMNIERALSRRRQKASTAAMGDDDHPPPACPPTRPLKEPWRVGNTNNRGECVLYLTILLDLTPFNMP